MTCCFTNLHWERDVDGYIGKRQTQLFTQTQNTSKILPKKPETSTVFQGFNPDKRIWSQRPNKEMKTMLIFHSTRKKYLKYSEKRIR